MRDSSGACIMKERRLCVYTWCDQYIYEKLPACTSHTPNTHTHGKHTHTHIYHSGLTAWARPHLRQNNNGYTLTDDWSDVWLSGEVTVYVWVWVPSPLLAVHTPTHAHTHTQQHTQTDLWPRCNKVLWAEREWAVNATECWHSHPWRGYREAIERRRRAAEMMERWFAWPLARRRID